jgi:tRNA-specific 2-thiouridylase
MLVGELEGCERGDRVVVAMSGGVDSSVAAALCQERGYEVIGITLQLYDGGEDLGLGGRSCCGVRDIDDARRVALKLGIGHYVLDYESRFRKGVIDDFVESYLRGETPIPCVRCNQEVKFSELLLFSKDLGAKALVTGHYVRRCRVGGGVELHKAVDEMKDQSYFLFATTQDQLEYCHFPLGGLAKSKTREYAAERGLGVAQKRDSQNICFAPDGDYAKVVRRHGGGGMEGDIVDASGRVKGRHAGIENYTVGQRRGLGLGAVTDTESFYVLRIDAEKNEVVVGPRELLAVGEIKLRDMNWLGGSEGAGGEAYVKVRSSMKAVACTYAWQDGGMKVRFRDPQYGVSRGQAGVLYEGDRVLGGGWIV